MPIPVYNLLIKIDGKIYEADIYDNDVVQVKSDIDATTNARRIRLNLIEILMNEVKSNPDITSIKFTKI